MHLRGQNIRGPERIEIHVRDTLSIRPVYGSLHDVFQFSNVPGPWMLYPQIFRFLCKFRGSLPAKRGYLYASNSNGTTIILKSGREYAQIAMNSLEKFMSTPIFNARRMYLRGNENLYCIGK